VYAVIRTGGKQYKVQVGDVIDVEHVAGDDGGGNVELVPLLVVDDEGKVSARPSELVGAKVTASVVGHHRGEKLRVFTYKNKSGQRHHQGHRQSLTRLKVEGIDPPGKAGAKARTARPAKDTEAKADSGAKAKDTEAKADSGAKAKDTEAKADSGAKAKDATATKAKTTRASAAKSSGATGSAKDAADAAAKPASRSGRTRAKQDEEKN
jgi:large subunit ribosomal protein L21